MIKYVTSLYWAFVTMSTTGYGDYTPVGIAERTWCMFSMIINMGITAYMKYLYKETLLACYLFVDASEQFIDHLVAHAKVEFFFPGTLAELYQHFNEKKVLLYFKGCN